MLEANAGILGGELPVDLDTALIAVDLPASTAASRLARSANRWLKHCRASTLSWISAMFNQLPCLGV